MLTRMYIDNFRNFRNFEFLTDDEKSMLVIGKNGSGKSNLRKALRIFQSIGRGKNRLGEIISPLDFHLGNSSSPMRMEIEATICSKKYQYKLVLDLPENFRELRISEEKLQINGSTVFSRDHGTVSLNRGKSKEEYNVQFNIDWHLVALPLIQDPARSNDLSDFQSWLKNMILLAPIPSLMRGEANFGTNPAYEDASNWSDWLSGLLDRFPAAYSTISSHLENVFHDLQDFRFERTGRDAKSLLINFESQNGTFEMPVEGLSDGEKCIFLCGVVIAAHKYDGPIFTFWDEPDQHLSIDEVGHFITSLRKSVGKGNQILMTSHNFEAIHRFSDNNTWVMKRESHLEPSRVRTLEEIGLKGSLKEGLQTGEIFEWQ